MNHRATVAALLIAVTPTSQAGSIASEYAHVYGAMVDIQIAKEGTPDARSRLRQRLRDYTLEDHHQELVREQRATRLQIQRLEQELTRLR